MKTGFEQFIMDLRLPYLRSLLLIALVPIFPEYVSFLLVIGAVWFAFQDKKQNNTAWRLGIIGFGLLVYCAYMTFTALVSTRPLQSVLIAAMWWFFWVVYLLIKNLLTSKERVNSFLLCLSAVAGLVGLITCIQYVINLALGINTGSVWNFLDRPVFELVPFSLTINLDYGTRAYSTFANPNMTAQYLVMVIPFIVSFTFTQTEKRMKLFSGVALFLACAGVALTFSRGAYLALIVLAVALLLLNIRKHYKAFLLYGAIALVLMPKQVFERLTSFDGGERTEIWKESFVRFLDNPITGYGVGTDTTAAIFERIGIDAPHAHNLVLQLLLEGGIIALLIMLFVGFFTAHNGIRLIRAGHKTAFWLGFGVLGFVTTFCIHGLVDYALTVPRLICTFVTLLGIAEQIPVIYGLRQPLVVVHRQVQVNT